MRALVPITLSIVTLLMACGSRSEPVAPPKQDWFVDRAKETGLDFVHANGMSGKLYVAEVLAPGVALFDFDNDGDLDVFLVQSGSLTGPGIPDPGSGIRARDPGFKVRAAGSFATISRSTATAHVRCGSPTSRKQAASSLKGTAWAWRPGTSTTTAGWICI